MSASRSTSLASRAGRLGLFAQAGLVSAALALIWFLAAAVAYAISGPPAVIASAVALLLCWLGGLLALALGGLFHGPTAAMQRMLVGMLARSVLPLLLGVVLHFKVPALAEAGMVFYLLIFYLATMAIETALLLAQATSSRVEPGTRGIR
jgi:hypothetical protein